MQPAPRSEPATVSEVTKADVQDQQLTELLILWAHGDESAMHRVVRLVYDELRRQAHRYLRREPAGHSLETTALVHETYLRLVDQRATAWEGRTHFFAIAAQLMRRILVDYARAQHAKKRGGTELRVPLNDNIAAPSSTALDEIDLMALDDALTQLAKLEPRQARIVELRYFAGLSIEETAEVLGVSIGPVKRDWVVARAWLKRALKARHASHPDAGSLHASKR